GHRVDQVELGSGCRHGTFVPPTLIEISSVSELTREVFGPVLHVLRYPREALDQVLEQINGTGYGLTFGVHSRIDETIGRVTQRVHAGNMYVNRNIVGAVVGVQPFGGECLSGTGPKAGGPLYMYRLLATRPAGLPPGVDGAGPLPRVMTLPGPTGEQNTYCLQARGAVLCVAATEAGARTQYAAAQATGNAALFMDTPAARAWHAAAGA